MKHLFLSLIAVFGLKAFAETNAPVTMSIESAYSFAETVEKLENGLKEKGLTVFAVIDHQEAAKQAGLEMQPAKVIIFGAPKVGTPLMQKDPTLALHLPLKVLVTEVEGQTQVIYFSAVGLASLSNLPADDIKNSIGKTEQLIPALIAPAK